MCLLFIVSLMSYSEKRTALSLAVKCKVRCSSDTSRRDMFNTCIFTNFNFLKRFLSLFKSLQRRYDGDVDLLIHG